MEPATGRGVDGVRRVSGEGRLLRPPVGVHRRHRGEERLGVGMLHPLVDVRRRADLHHLPEVHHEHPVAHVLDHVEIVGDEDVGEPELAPQGEEEVQHLRLHRLVEGGHRLVEDQQARLEGEGAGDVHPLALPPGELVRIAPDELRGIEPHQGEELAGPVARRRRRHPVHLRAEHDGLLDRQARIERGVRILEHHLHLPAHLAEPRRIVGVDEVAVEGDPSRVGPDEVHEEARGRRLAAPGLAHDPEHLPRPDLEVDVVDRLHPRHRAVEDPAPYREVLPKVPDLEQCRRGRDTTWRPAAPTGPHIRPRVHSRTSIALRRPSLSRLKVREVKKIITPGSAATHGLT